MARDLVARAAPPQDRPGADRVIRQWQSPTEAIRHAPDSLAARAAVWAGSAVLVGALCATPFVPIDRVVTSQGGEIVSQEALTTLQALDPSIIRSVAVKEGQRVARGQVLATLDPTVAEADVLQLRQQVAGLCAQIARAGAEMEGTPFALPSVLPPDIRPAWAVQKALFDQRAAQHAAQLKSFDEKTAVAAATVAKHGADAARYAEREAITHRVEDMRGALYRSGASSLVSLLQANDERQKLLQALDEGRNGLVEAQHDLAALVADRDAFLHGWDVALDGEMVTALNALDLAEASLDKAERHQDLVRLTAPGDAVVLSVSKLSVGSVLKQGDELMRLAPLDAPVEAELRLPSRDIGFVRAGDPVSLKIDAYGSFEHGAATGRLSWISEDAFTEGPDGRPLPPFYWARARLDPPHFTGLPADARLVPGMTLTGDVKIGTRSAFSYIMGGFFKGFGETMRGP